jgi:predicted nucleotidyltransferase
MQSREPASQVSSYFECTQVIPCTYVAMRTLDDIRTQLRAELPTLRERYDVDRLGICGSYVRGEQTEDSDLDLLVTFTETPGLIEFVGLEHYLEDVLGLSVDLGTPEGLKEGPAAENIRREVDYL